MRNLTAAICLITAVFFGILGESSALPPCPKERHPTASPWLNCFGTETFASGSKYVGEYRNNKRHGQGAFTFADGQVKEVMWENGEFKTTK
jgi:hypothetical protein